MEGIIHNRADLVPYKLRVFEAIQRKQSRQPSCKRWALYRKALRVFLLGELAKAELDAVVLYTLGEENGQSNILSVNGSLYYTYIPLPCFFS